MTRSCFANNNYYLITNHLIPYPTYIPPVFQCFALQDFLIYHLLLSTILLARRQPLRPINTIYNNNQRKMDKSIKTNYKCYQILFNKPLLNSKDKYIYGFRMKYDELKHKPSEKLLMRYIVEAIFGKCLFQDIHDGSFGGKDDKIWIDLEGNEYKYGVQTQLYCYDASLENMMNYRCDLVYADFGSGSSESDWITDPRIYFEEKARMDADDHKQGKNQWMQNYYRIKAQKEVLSYITVKSRANLDYDIQELIKKEYGNVD